jgi:hypothetical protein
MLRSMPFEQWKALHQTETTPQKLEEFKKSHAENVGTTTK